MDRYGFSGLDRKTRGKRIQIRIGIDLRRIEIQLLSSDQLRLLTLFDNGLKELLKHREAISQADLAETGVIGQRLVQIVAKTTIARSVDPRPDA